MVEKKKLTRSTKDRMIAGVAGGLGEYFDIDPVLIRLAFVLLAWGGGSGAVIYLILWLVLPESGKKYKDSDETIKENSEEIKEKANKMAKGVEGAVNDRNTEVWIGVAIVIMGFFFLAGTLGVPQFVNPFWYLGILVKYGWPLILIAIGLILILKNNDKK